MAAAALFRCLAQTTAFGQFVYHAVHQSYQDPHYVTEAWARFLKLVVKVDGAADLDLYSVDTARGRRMTVKHVTARIRPIMGDLASRG